MMSSIADNFRARVLLSATRLRHRFKPLAHELVIGSRGEVGGFRRLLLCVPSDSGTTGEVRNFYREMTSRFPAVEIDFLVSEEMREFYSSLGGEEHLIVYDEAGFSLLGFPGQDLFSRLGRNHYDIGLDLNQPLKPALAYLLLKTGIPCRLGIKGPDSSLFYNVEVVPDQGRPYGVILQVLSVL